MTREPQRAYPLLLVLLFVADCVGIGVLWL